MTCTFVYLVIPRWKNNSQKAILRDFMVATGLVILFKFDPNRRFFSPCDFEIWWMTLQINRAPLLSYIKLCASFQNGEFKLNLQSGNAKFGLKNSDFLVPCDLEIWWMILKNNRAPLLYYTKLCASFLSHQWIQTGVTVRKHPIWVKIDGFFCPVWPWNLTDDLETR